MTTPTIAAASHEERGDLRGSVRRFLAEKAPMSATRELMALPTGFDRAVWAQMAGQLGLQGVCVPEEYGGAGYGPPELAVVLEELGRVLYVGPYFATVALAAQTLLVSGDRTARERWLPAIVDGSLTATVAAGEPGESWVLGATGTAATPHAERWALTGRKSYVVDGADADLLLAFAATDSEIGLFAVEGSAAGVTRTPVSTLDQTRRLATVDLDSAPAVRLACDGSAVGERARDLALVALAAEQVGGAQRCLEMSVEYAKLRHAFGRPIGSYEAVKHRCADMLVAVETARSTAEHAATAAAEGGDELPIAAALAKCACSEAFTGAARSTIQVHGGIGFTWEHDAHLYLKRATADNLFLGTPAQHRDRLSRMAGVVDGDVA